MAADPNSLTIRAKILGTLIRDARVQTGRSIEECSKFLGVSDDKFEAFESGERSPSLPELEGIAYYLEIPIDQFWGSKPVQKTPRMEQEQDFRKFVDIRQRIIGTLLRQSREEAGLTLQDMIERTAIREEELEEYELGKKAIAVPELEQLIRVLNRSIREFQDQLGMVGKWASEKKAMNEFLQLPQEIKDFVSKPVNKPFLELAQRLSEMPVEKLRSVAEGLLEITY